MCMLPYVRQKIIVIVVINMNRENNAKINVIIV